MPLLKRLRISSISSQKFKKYVLYAFGEVVLIFIGITLAIWFNAKRDAENVAITEQHLLRNMHGDLKEDLAFLSEQRNTFIKVNRADSLVMHSDLSLLNYATLHNSLARWNFSNEGLHIDSYLALQSLDDKTLITNDSIESLINSYYGHFVDHFAWWVQYDFEQTFEAEKSFSFNHDFVILSPSEIEASDTTRKKLEMIAFFQKPHTQNIMRHNLSQKRVIINICGRGISQIEQLLNLIENEQDIIQESGE